MPFKINIADKSGKTFKLELESEDLMGKELHDKLQGKELLPSLEGYEFEISGMSDKAGFTSMAGVPGIGLKKVLLSYGKGMNKKPRREGKKKQSNPTPKGLRLRRTARGRVISQDIAQINLKTLKAGAKTLSEIFPDQNKAPEPEQKEGKKEEPKQEEAKPIENPTEKVPVEQKPVEEKSEVPKETPK